MKRTIPTKQTKRKQLGVLVNPSLWREFKATAIRLDKTATKFLEQAMREALNKHGKAAG